MSKRHNLRQRKKLHLGEFQEFGFTATAKITPGLNAEQRDALLDAFLAFIEAEGMMTAASTNEAFDAYLISSAVRGSTTENHRRLVREWLASRPDLAEVQVGELSDVWYPPDED
jgi:uncharacterized protein